MSSAADFFICTSAEVICCHLIFYLIKIEIKIKLYLQFFKIEIMNSIKLILFSIVIILFVAACKVSTETGAKHSNVRTDSDSITRGEELFNLKCAFCHDLNGSGDRVGPGMMGILKLSELPVSKRPATPGNIKKQLLEPYKRMPSFTYLTEEEIQDMIAFLNTL